MNEYLFGKGRQDGFPSCYYYPAYWFTSSSLLAPICDKCVLLTDATGLPNFYRSIGSALITTKNSCSGAGISRQPGSAPAYLDLHGRCDNYPIHAGACDRTAAKPGLKGTVILEPSSSCPYSGCRFAIQGLIWKLFLYPQGGPMANFLGLFGVQSGILGRPAERGLLLGHLRSDMGQYGYHHGDLPGRSSNRPGLSFTR